MTLPLLPLFVVWSLLLVIDALICLVAVFLLLAACDAFDRWLDRVPVK